MYPSSGHRLQHHVAAFDGRLGLANGDRDGRALNDAGDERRFS